MSKRAGLWLCTAALVVAVACGDGQQAATMTTTTTEPRLTKEEYIRQGDAICADVGRRVKAVPRPRNPQEVGPALDQILAIDREGSDRFRALKAPAQDQATADRLNSLLDQQKPKYDQAAAAMKAGDNTTGGRVLQEIESLEKQFREVARPYGFVECSKEG